MATCGTSIHGYKSLLWINKITILAIMLPSASSAAAASNIEWMTNAGFFQHGLTVTATSQEEKINVYGSHLTIGMGISDWEVSYSTSNSSGRQSDAVDIDYNNSGSSISISRYISNWRLSAHRYSGTSHLSILTPSVLGTYQQEKQRQTSLSLELERGWYKNQWSWDIWSGLSSLKVLQDTIVTINRLTSITKEEAKEKIFLIGGFAGYYLDWEAVNVSLQPGVSFNYQRHISGNTHSDKELQGRAGRIIRSTSQSLSPDNLQWSTLAASLDMTHRHVFISLLHQYPLNKPHEHYSGISVSLLF